MSRMAALLRQASAASPKLSFDLAEEPVPLTEFITGKKYLHNPALGERQYLAVKHLEQIYFPEHHKELALLHPEWEPVRFVSEVILQWGKGSGKDHVCRIGAARVAYLLCCLRSPQRYYGIPEQDFIHILNVASSSKQAFRGFFDPLKKIVQRDNSWFADHGVVAVADTISFPKQIQALSGHSDAETQEGLNLILGIADEISAFRTAAEASMYSRGAREASGTSEALMEMMRTSSGSRFPMGNAKVAAISYPRFRGDAIQQLTNEAKADVAEVGDASRYYVDGPAATWEINPRIGGKEDSPVIAEAYKKNPESAASKYECQPKGSSSHWFRNEDAVDEAFAGDGEHADPFQVSYWYGADADGVGKGWQAKVFLDPVRVRPIAGAVYAMHADLAVSADRAGIAMCHVKNYTTSTQVDVEGATQVLERKPIVKVDFVGSFESDMGERPVPREIRLAWARELCYQLQRQGFAIKSLTFDGFQSTDSMQQLRARGIDSYRVSTDLSNEPMMTMKELIYEGRLEAYYRKIVMDEIKALSETRRGRIDHPPGGSKDEADALAGAIMGALAVGGQETGEVIDPLVSMPDMPMTIPSYMPDGMNDWGDVL